MRNLILFACLFGCSKAPEKFEPVQPVYNDRADYQALSERLAVEFTHGGFGVVSRGPDGAPVHTGEALIWGGIALWAMPCDTGLDISKSMASMITKHKGAMIRVEPLGEYVGGREVTLDGALGALMGISRRITSCGEVDLWKEPVALMVDFHNANKDKLHPYVNATLVGQFKYIRDLIAHRLGLRDEPDTERLRDLEKIVGGWALAVQIAHQTGQGSDACFRINLGLTALVSVETLKKGISGQGRDYLCANTRGMDIPTVDHWCGRKNIKDYINTYQENQWEYRHQRCGSWEDPDGDNNTSHALDKIVAYVFANGWYLLQN